VGGRGTPGWNLLDNYDESLAEVMEFKKVGGGTIVDVTNFGLSRNPEWLKRISEASGLHVVMGSGWYQKALHPPDMTDRTVEELTDIIVRDIVVGAQGNNHQIRYRRRGRRAGPADHRERDQEHSRQRPRQPSDRRPHDISHGRRHSRRKAADTRYRRV
jgi:hypothetical protein